MTRLALMCSILEEETASLRRRNPLMGAIRVPGHLSSSTIRSGHERKSAAREP
jgi:hypothetical protein